MELIEFGDLTPRQRSEVEGDEADPFEAGEVNLQFRAKERHVGLQADDGTLVASTGWVLTQAQVGEERFAVAGIGGVIVRSAFRGQGLARQVLEAAIVRMRASGVPFAVLFCRPDRAGLYQRLQFTRVEGDVLVAQPDGYVAIPLQTMWRALQPGLSWPEGQLVLHSLPF